MSDDDARPRSATPPPAPASHQGVGSAPRRSPARRLVTVVRHPRAVAGRLVHLRRDRRIARWEVIHAGPARLITVRTRHGVITLDSRDAAIGASLFCLGHWEQDLMRATMAALRAQGLTDPRRRTLVDVGANIGTTTVAFLRSRSFERALALEPEPANFALLQRNVRQNDLDGRVTCLRVALGDTSGSARLALSPTNLGDHRIEVTSSPGELGEETWETVDVPVERLDDVVGRAAGGGAAEVGLLWMDVQGYEGHVLAGAPGIIAAGVPVELELWPYGLIRAGTTPDTFMDLLANGFARFVDLRDPRRAARPVADVAGLFDRLVGPDDATELLLFR